MNTKKALLKVIIRGVQVVASSCLVLSPGSIVYFLCILGQFLKLKLVKVAITVLPRGNLCRILMNIVRDQ